MDDILFKKGCRVWHAEIERCAADKLTLLKQKVEQDYLKWKAYLGELRSEAREAELKAAECRRKEASASAKMRMIGQLIALAERKIMENKK